MHWHGAGNWFDLRRHCAAADDSPLLRARVAIESAAGHDPLALLARLGLDSERSAAAEGQWKGHDPRTFHPVEDFVRWSGRPHPLAEIDIVSAPVARSASLGVRRDLERSESQTQGHVKSAAVGRIGLGLDVSTCAPAAESEGRVREAPDSDQFETLRVRRGLVSSAVEALGLGQLQMVSSSSRRQPSSNGVGLGLAPPAVNGHVDHESAGPARLGSGLGSPQALSLEATRSSAHLAVPRPPSPLPRQLEYSPDPNPLDDAAPRFYPRPSEIRRTTSGSKGQPSANGSPTGTGHSARHAYGGAGAGSEGGFGSPVLPSSPKAQGPVVPRLNLAALGLSRGVNGSGSGDVYGLLRAPLNGAAASSNGHGHGTGPTRPVPVPAPARPSLNGHTHGGGGSGHRSYAGGGGSRDRSPVAVLSSAPGPAGPMATHVHSTSRSPMERVLSNFKGSAGLGTPSGSDSGGYHASTRGVDIPALRLSPLPLSPGPPSSNSPVVSSMGVGLGLGTGGVAGMRSGSGPVGLGLAGLGRVSSASLEAFPLAFPSGRALSSPKQVPGGSGGMGSQSARN